MTSKPRDHLRLVPEPPEPESEPLRSVEPIEHLDRMNAYCVRLLAGYVRGGYNNHDILMRGVGVAEACALLRGTLPDGLQVTDFIDRTLVRLTRVPDHLLVDIMEQTSYSYQLVMIERW